MKRIAVALVAAFAFAVCAQAGQKTVVIISKSLQNQFYQAAFAGAMDAGKKFDVRVIVNGPDAESNIPQQVEQVQAAINQKPAALILAACDPTSVQSALTRAKENGLPVIGFDSGQAQMDAINSGLMAGAITQNPVGIGECVVSSAMKAIKGETLEKTIDTGFYWYDKANINDPKIQAVLYQ